uniref:Secreted protein n=1 Tax=Panagrellus redivivus TaxID=6233 RepID=A0A7E4UWT3_PANRE
MMAAAVVGMFIMVETVEEGIIAMWTMGVTTAILIMEATIMAASTVTIMAVSVATITIAEDPCVSLSHLFSFLKIKQLEEASAVHPSLISVPLSELQPPYSLTTAFRMPISATFTVLDGAAKDSKPGTTIGAAQIGTITTTVPLVDDWDLLWH